MAKVIDALPPRQGRPAVHDWDGLFDGQYRMLEKGSDFTAKPQSFRNAAAHAARQRGYDLATRIDAEGNVYLGPKDNSKSSNGNGSKSDKS